MKPSPQAIAEILRATPAVLRTMLAHLDDELLSWRPAPNEWCIKEVIGHLIEMDTLAFGDRIRIILAEDNPEMQSMNVNTIAAARHDDKRPIEELLVAFEQERETAVSYILQLPVDQLGRIGTFPVNRAFKASDFLYEWPYHDHDHIKQISSIVQEHVWPHLSPTMQAALRK